MADIIDIGFRVQGADQAAEQIKGITNETKKLEGEQKKAEVGVKSYAAQIKALRLELISLGQRTKENGAAYDDLSERIRALDDAQEDLLIGTGQLDDQLSALPGPVGRAAGVFKTYDIALKNVRGAKIALIKQFPILKNAIAATGIGALVVVFGLLVGAVIKAFNSFKPLQEAVGRLGVAFDLVEKLVQPLINLIGTGLTKAVDFAARSIAFLTGNLEEYNKEVANKKTTEQLKTQLEQQSALYELNKDRFTQLERDKRDAYEANLQRFKEIDAEEGLSTELKDERKRASNALYFRDLRRAENEEQKRKDENLKKEQERRKKLKELTQEQLREINVFNQAVLNTIDRQLGILKARDLEGLGNPEDIDKIKNSTELWNKALSGTKTQLQTLQEQLSFVAKGDPAFGRLQRELKDLETIFTGAFSDGLLSTSAAIQDAFNKAQKSVAALGKEGFVDEITKPFEAILNNYQNALRLFADANQTGEDEIKKTIQSILEFEKNIVSDSLLTRTEAEQKLSRLREDFIKRYETAQIESYTFQLKENKSFTEQQRIDALSEFKKGLSERSKAAFEDLKENLSIIQAFTNQSVAINTLITKKLVGNMQEAIKKGGLDKLIKEDLPTYADLIVKLDKDLKGSNVLIDPFQQTATSLDDLVKELAKFKGPIALSKEYLAATQLVENAFMSLGKGIEIQVGTANLLLEQLVNRRKETDDFIRKLDTEYLGGQYEQQILQLEQQKRVDKEMLKEKAATQEQMIALDEMYAKRKQRIDDQYTLYVMDQTAMIFGNLASFFHEETVAFKSLKYFEAMITAISSSVKAYESALAYGGPAGPILAPILGATTFAVQQQQAMKILQTSVPTPPNLTGREGGLVFGRTHEQGGVNAELEGGEFILNRRTMMIPGVADLALRLNNLDPNTTQAQSSSQVVKAYVLSGEITTAQKADKRIRDLSRL